MTAGYQSADCSIYIAEAFVFNNIRVIKGLDRKKQPNANYITLAHRTLINNNNK